MLKIETPAKDFLLSEESDFQKAIVRWLYLLILHFCKFCVHFYTFYWLLFRESGNCGLQVVQKRADMTELLQEEARDLLDNRIQRAPPKKKKKKKIWRFVMTRWFATLRPIIYQKNLFWTEICKEPDGHVRYIQNLPCTIFSHTHKSAEDKDNHPHKLLQMAHVLLILVAQ